MKLKKFLAVSISVITVTLGFSEVAYSRTNYKCIGKDLFEQRCRDGACSNWYLAKLDSKYCRGKRYRQRDD